MKYVQWIAAKEKYVNAVVILGILSGRYLESNALIVGSAAVLCVVTGVIVPTARSTITMAKHDARMRAFDERRSDRRGVTKAELMITLCFVAAIVTCLVIAFLAVQRHIPHVS